ncbi:bromodomain-containing protein 7 [Fukomys damarensis]|uniref:bromodomain-containing protein 7 n=1 Tax=Fukomys damarensis TaxID=885580 RepID=UPI0005400CB3|nr:bromodomain-containing protein 7 [Fukomys damarensis]
MSPGAPPHSQEPKAPLPEKNKRGLVINSAGGKEESDAGANQSSVNIPERAQVESEQGLPPAAGALPVAGEKQRKAPSGREREARRGTPRGHHQERKEEPAATTFFGELPWDKLCRFCSREAQAKTHWLVGARNSQSFSTRCRCRDCWPVTLSNRGSCAVNDLSQQITSGHCIPKELPLSQSWPLPLGTSPSRHDSWHQGGQSRRGCQARAPAAAVQARAWEVSSPSPLLGQPRRPLFVSDYVEKPLKLVLKVGGNEVTELSTGSSGHDSSLFEDKNDHDKHKDRKRKKRKKGEKQVPGEEKGRKRRRVKEDKRKRDRDRVENEAEKDFHAPVRLDLPPEKPLTSSLAKQEEVEQTPLQEALNQLMRQLQRKDPSAFFSFPVTDFIAPGYSMIIKHPMDFSTMKEKIKNNDYQSIEELKDNFKLMCTNAMIYNKPETIYYKAAKKLLHSGMKILSQERIQSLKQSIEFMADLQKTRKQRERADASQSGEDSGCWPRERDSSLDPDIQAFRNPSKDNKKKDKDVFEDKWRSSNSERDQEQIDRAVQESGGKLTRRPANSQCEFERRKPDGTTTLGLLHPVDPIIGEPGYCPVRLGMTTGRLQSGVNTLQGFKEDKRNKVTPVLYLNYGPYSSYAPHYDSTFANISKDDSDLIYSTYGEDSDLPSDFSVHEFLATCQDYPYVMADSLLDVLTKGGHSRTLQELEMSSPEDEGQTRTLDTAKEMEVTEVEPAGHLDSGTQDRLTALKAVINFGVPVEVFDSEEAEVFQRKLDETTRLLRELQDAQNERLSTRPPPNMICLLGPSYREMHLAEQVTNNLKELAQQVTPGDIVSMYGIRKAMGISIPSPMVENNVVDLTGDLEELKKTDVAECGPDGS